MKEAEKRVALVTGGSSGIGRAAAVELARRGFRVYSVSRNGGEPDGVTHLAADVTDPASLDGAVSRILSECGRLDVLITAAGFGIAGAVEFSPADAVARQSDVNFHGTVNAVRAVLPVMRAAKSGRIVMISSVAAVFPIPYQAFYSATKAAIDAFAFALRSEVRPFGIRVCTVRPGDTATGFTAARKTYTSPEADLAYGGRIEKSVARMEHDEQNGMTADRVGAFTARVALKKRPRPYYTPGFGYRFLCLLGKILPASLADRIVYLLYGGK